MMINRESNYQGRNGMTEENTFALYERFATKVGDPLVASHLTVAHVMSAGQELAREQALTVPEAADRLKLSEKKVYQMCGSGELRHHRVGRSIRIRPEDIDGMLRDTAEAVEPPRRPARQRHLTV
jgi:excisionase family DNA binding protein